MLTGLLSFLDADIGGRLRWNKWKFSLFVQCRAFNSFSNSAQSIPAYYRQKSDFSRRYFFLFFFQTCFFFFVSLFFCIGAKCSQLGQWLTPQETYWLHFSMLDIWCRGKKEQKKRNIEMHEWKWHTWKLLLKTQQMQRNAHKCYSVAKLHLTHHIWCFLPLHTVSKNKSSK